MNEQIYFKSEESVELIDELNRNGYSMNYDSTKHTLRVFDVLQEQVAYLRLPMQYRYEDTLEDEDCINVFYISIESDNAAFSMRIEGESVYHTTLSSYMTRRKQGYSQHKYLNKKGKSRAGSRVRLSSTNEFFIDINSVLTTVFEEYDIERIVFGCSKSLIPLLYSTTPECPIDKSDERLLKLPLHIQKSNTTNLDLAIRKLEMATLFYDRERFYPEQLDII